MDGFPLQIELRVDWGDLDLFGHVNNLAILKYVQSGRVNYLEALGLMQPPAETKIGVILASTNCQFRQPLFYPGQITVCSTVDEIKNTSFRLRHGVYNQNREIAAETQDVLVLFDYSRRAKLNIPDDIRQRIENLQNTRSK